MRVHLITVLFCIASFYVQADQITLKNGQTIEGKIIDQNDKMMKVKIDNTILTYYEDQLDPATWQSKIEAILSRKKEIAIKIVHTYPFKDEVKKYMDQKLKLSYKEKQYVLKHLDWQEVDKIREEALIHSLTIKQLYMLYDICSSPGGWTFLGILGLAHNATWAGLKKMVKDTAKAAKSDT